MATPSVSEMQKQIGKAYPGPKWKKKVAAMPKAQILRLFFEFEARKAAQTIIERKQVEEAFKGKKKEVEQ